MTEHTDKSPQKPGRTPPRKRAGKARSPDGKRAMRPPEKPTGEKPGGENFTGEKLAGEKLAGPAPDTALPTTGPDGAPGARGGARGDVRGDARGLAPDPATSVCGPMRPRAAAPAKRPGSGGRPFACTPPRLLERQ